MNVIQNCRALRRPRTCETSSSETPGNRSIWVYSRVVYCARTDKSAAQLGTSNRRNGNTVRIFALGCRKAFDLIDHSLLLAKLSAYNINPYIVNWITAFLKDGKQWVKLAHDCLLEWGSIRAGVPLGTKLGPWLFLVMMNDLKVPSASDCIKYVDDTTVHEIVSKNSPRNA